MVAQRRASVIAFTPDRTSKPRIVAVPEVDKQDSYMLSSILANGFRLIIDGECFQCTPKLKPGRSQEDLYVHCRAVLGKRLSEADEREVLDALEDAHKKDMISLVKQSDYGRNRFETMLKTGFLVAGEGRFDSYAIELRDGTTPDSLYAFCRQSLGTRNFPTLMPDFDNNAAQKLFQEAEMHGLVKLVKQ